MALEDLAWMIGLSIIVALALLFSFLTSKNLQSFFIYFTLFSGFSVWSGLIPLWVLIVNLILLTLIIIYNLNKRRIS